MLNWLEAKCSSKVTTAHPPHVNPLVCTYHHKKHVDTRSLNLSLEQQMMYSLTQKVILHFKDFFNRLTASEMD